MAQSDNSESAEGGRRALQRRFRELGNQNKIALAKLIARLGEDNWRGYDRAVEAYFAEVFTNYALTFAPFAHDRKRPGRVNPVYISLLTKYKDRLITGHFANFTRRWPDRMRQASRRRLNTRLASLMVEFEALADSSLSKLEEQYHRAAKSVLRIADEIETPHPRTLILVGRLMTEGWSVLDLAQNAGVSYKTARDYVLARRTPRPDTLKKIAKALKCSVLKLPV